jgi:alpha-L-fucosidase 2
MSKFRGLCALVLPFFLFMSTIFAAPSRSTALHNVEYSRAAGTPLYLDGSLPSGPGPFPAVILVHGGGWVRGDRRVEVAPLFQPLTDANFAWFSIDYRLSSDFTQFGVAIDDVKSAIRFVKAHAAEYRIDPARIALIGESAGGQLAAMAALDGSPDLRVKAVVGLYAPMDLVDLAKNSSLVPTQIRSSLLGTPFESLILARLGQLSPVSNVKLGAPDFLLIHGTADALVPYSQSVHMCERLKRAGAACEVYPVQGGGHGIRWWESAHPREAAAYKRKMVQWLTAELSARHATS